MSDVMEKLVAADAFAVAADDLIEEYETHDTVDMESVVAMLEGIGLCMAMCGVEQTAPMVVNVIERLRRAVPQHERLELGSPLEPDEEEVG